MNIPSLSPKANTVANYAMAGALVAVGVSALTVLISKLKSAAPRRREAKAHPDVEMVEHAPVISRADTIAMLHHARPV